MADEGAETTEIASQIGDMLNTDQIQNLERVAFNRCEEAK